MNAVSRGFRVSCLGLSGLEGFHGFWFSGFCQRHGSGQKGFLTLLAFGLMAHSMPNLRGASGSSYPSRHLKSKKAGVVNKAIA